MTPLSINAQSALTLVLNKAVSYANERGTDGLAGRCAGWLKDADAELREWLRQGNNEVGATPGVYSRRAKARVDRTGGTMSWSRRARSQNRRMAPYLFLSPLVAILLIFFFWPLLQSLLLSFFSTAGPHTRRFVGLGNYAFLIAHDRFFWLATANTIVFTLVFLLIQIPRRWDWRCCSIIGRCAANGYSDSASSRLISSGSLCGCRFFRPAGAEAGTAERACGTNRRTCRGYRWLTRPNMVLPAVLLAALWLSIGYGMIYFLAALQAVDANLYEAAALDGQGDGRAFGTSRCRGFGRC